MKTLCYTVRLMERDIRVLCDGEVDESLKPVLAKIVEQAINDGFIESCEEVKL